SGNATLLGGDGNDLLVGGNGKDYLSGDAGNDTLQGNNGADTLLGGSGDDVLTGAAGNDVMDGGTGTDVLVETDDVNFTLTGTPASATLTGLGTDTLTNIEQARLTGGTTSKAIDASGFTGDTTLQGGGGDDTLSGGSGHNLFVKPVGEVGNETMIGGGAGSTNEYQLWDQGATRLVSPGGFDLINFSLADSAITFDLNVTDGTPQVVDAKG